MAQSFDLLVTRASLDQLVEVRAIEGSPTGADLVRATVLALGKHELQIRQAVETYGE